MVQPTACWQIIIRNKANLAKRIITDSWRRPNQMVEQARTLIQKARKSLNRLAKPPCVIPGGRGWRGEKLVLTGRSACCGFVDGRETEKPRTTCCSLGCKPQVSTKPTLNDDRIQYPVPTQDGVLGWDGVSRGDAARGRLRTLLAFTRQAILCRRSAALMSARATLISAERAQQKLAASSVSASPVKINFAPRQPRPGLMKIMLLQPVHFPPILFRVPPRPAPYVGRPALDTRRGALIPRWRRAWS
jgi:hypothetical protein